ncbi:MAG: hypothetical protein JWO68_3732 [Actinomycetia bacterium]|nr:hypothetical protein [Actinomycetes bacterium]
MARAWWFDRWFGVRDFHIGLVDVVGVIVHPENAGRASLVIGLRDGERVVLDLSTTKGVAELLERHGVPVGPES